MLCYVMMHHSHLAETPAAHLDVLATASTNPSELRLTSGAKQRLLQSIEQNFKSDPSKITARTTVIQRTKQQSSKQ